MPSRDPRVDAYIEKSAPFAQPVLVHLRETVHAACPAVEETIKWGFPHFDYQGIMCSMAAFREHCAFGFWKASLIPGLVAEEDGMGSFGRIASVKDLPSRAVLTKYVKQAMRLNEEGVSVPRARKAPKPAAPVPPALASALARHRAANAVWTAFSPAARREYAEWIAEAKRDDTRDKRIAQAVEWIAEGKQRNWKYQGR